MIKGLTKDGQLVDRDAPGVAYTVDDAEEGYEKFIESVRARAARDPYFVDGMAHLSVDGVAVPISPDDEESPEEKLARLRAAGVVPERGAIATSAGAKTLAELGATGLDATAPNVPGSPPPPPPPPPPLLNGDEPSVLSPEQQLLSVGLGKGVADKLFGAGIVSRDILATKTDTELDAIAGIGETTIKEIRDFLGKTEPVE